MNLLYCKISRLQSLNTDANEYYLKNSQYTSPCIYLYANDKLNHTYPSIQIINRKLMVALVGDILNYDSFDCKARNGVELAAHLYMRYGIESLKELDGLFSIMIVDFELNKAFVVQDRYTSNNHIYYYSDASNVYICNDVKYLIKHAGIIPELNKEALPVYLHYSFVPGNQTLFKNIFKLQSEYIIKYNFTDSYLNTEHFPRKIANVLHNDKESEFTNYFDLSLKRCLTGIENNKLGFLFSGGFDTNYILARTLHLKPNEPINLFTLGTMEPDSEIHKARKIIDIYKNYGFKINLHEYIIKNNEILRTPQMMFEFGEPLSEPGVILHACVGDLIKKHGIEIVIGGDCNDQVFDAKNYLNMAEKLADPLVSNEYPIYGRLRLGEFDRMLTYKFFTQFEIPWILKDEYESLVLRLENYSWIFTNYFLLKRFGFRQYAFPRLPFLGREYVDFIDTHINDDESIYKSFHAKMVRKALPAVITDEIEKIGGAIKGYLFFEDSNLRKELFKLLLESETTKEFFNVTNVNKLLTNLETALNEGYQGKGFYKASFISTRIYNLVCFVAWYEIFIKSKEYIDQMECNMNLIDLFKRSSVENRHIASMTL